MLIFATDYKGLSPSLMTNSTGRTRNQSELRDDLENRLAELQKMEAVAARVAGMAHNLSGPLSSIRGTAELSESLLLESDPAAAAGHEIRSLLLENMRRIIENADHIKEIIDSILIRIKSDQVSAHQPLDINRILENELRILENDLFFKHRVAKEIRMDPGLPEFNGVYSDISQCFDNLLKNASEALKGAEKPRLTVETGRGPGCIEVLIRDNGGGIPPEIRERIFEPFFSTKRLDTAGGGMSGCGLGLYTVKRILAPYGAGLELQSAGGETEFKVRLPLGKPDDRAGD